MSKDETLMSDIARVGGLDVWIPDDGNGKFIGPLGTKGCAVRTAESINRACAHAVDKAKAKVTEELRALSDEAVVANVYLRNTRDTLQAKLDAALVRAAKVEEERDALQAKLNAQPSPPMPVDTDIAFPRGRCIEFLSGELNGRTTFVQSDAGIRTCTPVINRASAALVKRVLKAERDRAAERSAVSKPDAEKLEPKYVARQVDLDALQAKLDTVKLKVKQAKEVEQSAVAKIEAEKAFTRFVEQQKTAGDGWNEESIYMQAWADCEAHHGVVVYCVYCDGLAQLKERTDMTLASQTKCDEAFELWTADKAQGLQLGDSKRRCYSVWCAAWRVAEQLDKQRIRRLFSLLDL